jgi:hypothetical protein
MTQTRTEDDSSAQTDNAPAEATADPQLSSTTNDNDSNASTRDAHDATTSGETNLTTTASLDKAETGELSADQSEDKSHEAEEESKQTPTTKQRRPYLVVLPAGDTSLHADESALWLEPTEERLFDLHIIYYGTNEEKAIEYEKHADSFERRQGPKWQLIRHMMAVSRS